MKIFTNYLDIKYKKLNLGHYFIKSFHISHCTLTTFVAKYKTLNYNTL